MSEQQKPAPKREANPTTHPEPSGPVPPPPPRRKNGAKDTFASPWLTTRQVADYAGRHRDTVLLALRRKELKGFQRNGANATWRVHRDDVDRWMRGEPPARGNARLRSA